jgi:uncharacterized protein YkwD
MGAGAGHARCGVAAIVAVTALLIAGQGTAAAEGCLYQDEAVTSTNQARVERSLVCLTNAVRRRAGLESVLADSRLGAAARGHSADMVGRGYFSHTSPEGSSPSDRARAAGYPGGAAENIAASSRGTAISVFSAWRGSPGHNANILGAYVATGLGVAPSFAGGGRGITATQMFGSARPSGSDGALDLYYPNERCKAVKLKKAAFLKAKKKALTRKQRRKLRRLNRKIGRRCQPGAVEAPLL